jgi:hypothetical protein
MEYTSKEEVFTRHLLPWIEKAKTGIRSVLIILETHNNIDLTPADRRMDIGKYISILELILKSGIDTSTIGVTSEMTTIDIKYSSTLQSVSLEQRPYAYYYTKLYEEFKIPIFPSKLTPNLRDSNKEDSLIDDTVYLNEIREAIVSRPIIICHMGIGHLLGLLRLITAADSDLGKFFATLNYNILNLTNLVSMNHVISITGLSKFYKLNAPIYEDIPAIEIGTVIESKYPIVPMEAEKKAYYEEMFPLKGYSPGTKVRICGLTTNVGRPYNNTIGIVKDYVKGERQTVTVADGAEKNFKLINLKPKFEIPCEAQVVGGKYHLQSRKIRRKRASKHYASRRRKYRT